jgi:hypothetical protein
VNDLQDRFRDTATVGITHVYYNFRRKDEQRTEGILRSLIKQLSRGQLSLPKSVVSLHKKYREKQMRPALNEILEVLRCMMASYSRVLIIIDALDEC